MEIKNFPTVSILIPTLNSANVLSCCLESIKNQNYPKNKMEIIVADGGSTDKTLDIAKKYGAKIYINQLKTGEAGKAVAFQHARGELIALIDSDNILPDKEWLKQMIAPFSEAEIIGSEPWEYTYRGQDGFITRYCALLGMNDPLCHFLGNYDRQNSLSGKWTDLPVVQEDKGEWIKITLKPDTLPTIGANGTLLRRKILINNKSIDKYFIDIDILAELAAKNPVKFAKVKIGIIHLYCGSSIATFIHKQKRRAKDYFYYHKQGMRAYPWQKQKKNGLLKFIFACITVLPLFYQAVKGYSKKPDTAWFFHPIACWITLFIYALITVESRFKLEPQTRKRWRQLVL